MDSFMATESSKASDFTTAGYSASKEHSNDFGFSAVDLPEIPMTRQEMTEALIETIRQNHLQDGYIRLLVTRGSAIWV